VTGLTFSELLPIKITQYHYWEGGHGHYTYQEWSSVNPVMLVQCQRKLLPNLDKNDLLGFQIFLTCRSFKNINTGNIVEWLQSDAC
jgi:hypothetical protein